MPNESALTPAHANLSMKETSDESPELVHPHAPKNKRQAAPKKFTFEDLSHKSTLSESRDEDDLTKLEAKDAVNEVERDESKEPNDAAGETTSDDKLKADGEAKTDGEAEVETAPTQNNDFKFKTEEDVEHEEGAYWFTECSVPQVDTKNSFPTEPFDEEPHTPAELNLFCNHPTPTLTPLARVLPATTTADQLDTIQESDHEIEDKNPELKEDTSPEITEDANKVNDEPQKALEVVKEGETEVQPAATAPIAPVVSNISVPMYAEDLDMAPSDELENRGSTEELPAMDVPMEELPKALQPLHKYADTGEGDLTQSLGDIRQQFDHMRVSDALVAAVTQTFQQEHDFLGSAEQLCGHDLMNWFNGRSE
jgi:hypothetical protein